MKNFLNAFFLVLGVIFFIIILFGIYFYVADPMNLKPLLSSSNSKLPTSLTPEQEVCAVAKIDPARVIEIKNGATPTLSEYITVKDCF
jgi:hypothetical protein